MKHNYISCDCCGKIFGTDWDKFYRIKHGLVFGGFFHPNDGRRIDICQNCWEDLRWAVYDKLIGR